MTTFFCLTFTGVPFTSLSLVGIFILLGVGVDDVLVLLESFRMARITIPNGGTVETRVRFATERAGVSITITSATSVIAFSLGSMTVSPFLLSYGQLDTEVVLTLITGDTRGELVLRVHGLRHHVRLHNVHDAIHGDHRGA
jgi:predicted RND superfamily exporter protein